MSNATDLRVLVVDDDDRYAEALTALLEADGMTVVGRARDGAEAIELARVLAPSVITMDIDMPVMNGVDATRELAPLGVPIIILSGTDASGAASAAVAAGAAASLTKSDAPHALTVLIRSTTH
jgi:DNA-binding NarL/FixJ family response regulator